MKKFRVIFDSMRPTTGDEVLIKRGRGQGTIVKILKDYKDSQPYKLEDFGDYWYKESDIELTDKTWEKRRSEVESELRGWLVAIGLGQLCRPLVKNNIHSIKELRKHVRLSGVASLLLRSSLLLFG